MRRNVYPDFLKPWESVLLNATAPSVWEKWSIDPRFVTQKQRKPLRSNNGFLPPFPEPRCCTLGVFNHNPVIHQALGSSTFDPWGLSVCLFHHHISTAAVVGGVGDVSAIYTSFFKINCCFGVLEFKTWITKVIVLWLLVWVLSICTFPLQTILIILFLFYCLLVSCFQDQKINST